MAVIKKFIPKDAPRKTPPQPYIYLGEAWSDKAVLEAHAANDTGFRVQVMEVRTRKNLVVVVRPPISGDLKTVARTITARAEKIRAKKS